MALEETAEFDKAVNTTVKLLKELNMLDNTLIIVTSDHANLLSINGYPNRGSSIFDVAGKSRVDGVKYTTLTYSVGYSPKPIYTRVGSLVIRQDPTIFKTTSHEFTQQVGIQESTGVHGGSDVAVHAKGIQFYKNEYIQFLIHNIHYRTNGTLISFDPRTKLYCTRDSICIKNWSLQRRSEQQIMHRYFKYFPHMLFYIDFILFLIKCYEYC